jgi:serine/threonine-protein kinase
MGTVHLGRIVGASGFSRVVAIKRLFPGLAADASFRQMLIDEARFASRIRQPNVVPILDVVEAESDLYVVMEYVHGLPLADVVGRGAEPMPVPIAVAIAEAVLFGLHAAHEARAEDGTPLGIVHRDVSPQNILVGADGVARLIDFGIAKAATRMQVTDPGILKGKVAYMAPEQLLFQPVARHADVFSASVVLWEMLAKRPLFPFDAGERVRRIAERPAPPGHYSSGVDAALDAVVLRGLDRDPARRFPTAEAMAIELRRDRTVASTVDVARWLAEMAADDLELSEERVRLFEQSPGTARLSPDSSGGAPLVAAIPTSVGTSTAASALTPVARTRRRGWVVPFSVAVALLLAFASFALVPRLLARPQAPAGALPIDSAAAATPLPPFAQPALPVPTSVAPAPAAPSSGSAAPSASSAADRKPVAGKTHHGAKPKCDPPYTVDADGFKHYDPRCF